MLNNPPQLAGALRPRIMTALPRDERTSPMAIEEQVLEALRQVIVPDVQRDVVALGMVKDVKAMHGIVTFTIELTPASTGLQGRLDPAIQKAVRQIAGVTDVAVHYLVRPEALRTPKPMGGSSRGNRFIQLRQGSHACRDNDRLSR